jgi:hypothetical protein
MPPVHVFISYSHDSDTHVNNVVTLANSLRSDGVDAQLDRFVEAPPEGWPRWVENQIVEADFIICVCTAQYRTSFRGKNDPQKGLGVNQEGYLIGQDLYNNGNRSKRYIPVQFDGAGRDVIPLTLAGFQSYELPAEYEQLFRQVMSQPATQPANLGWRSEPLPPAPRQPALATLAEKSEGFERQGELTRFITPMEYPIERLAPRDGLYLSRTAHDVITTVWVTARGPLDYVLDSIRIRDLIAGGLGGNPVVTITPDAEYRFTYAEGSDRVHALNPALAIGPSTRNRVWFTLGTAMEVGFYYVGTLLISVQYQASDGRTGTLFLAETPADGWDLAKLVGVEVEFPILLRHEPDVGQLVITPEGVQRGFESEHPPECRYIPFPPLTLQHDRLLRSRAKWQETLQQRDALHRALKHETKRDELKNWLTRDSKLAADLLGGMADEESTAILLQEYRSSRSSLALTGLCIRHVAVGDELLADFARENESVLSSNQLETILSALMLRPVGAWIDVLLRHQKSETETVRNILAEMEPELTVDDRSRILAAPNGPLGCELFVRGTLNNWTTPDSARLVYQGDGNYKATLSLAAGSHEFKIGSTDWRHGNLGGRHDGLRVTTDEQVELFSDILSHNLSLDVGGSSGEYTFTVDARNFARVLIRITRSG